MILDEAMVASLHDVGVLGELFEVADEVFPAKIVELRQALDAGDREVVRRVAHFCRGSARQLGASRLGEAFHVLESRASSLDVAELDQRVIALPGLWAEARAALAAWIPASSRA